MAFLNALRLAGCGAAAAAAAAVLLCAPAAARQAGEQDIKAAFLYNFTRFVDWPDEAFDGPEDAFRLCVFADAQFVRAVDEIIAGEMARGRPLQRMAPEASAVGRCHILFVGRAEAAGARRLLSRVAGAPILTVGETPGFLEQGGAIAFVLEENKVRFDVNLGATQRARLAVSSKLLRVARHVRAVPGS